MSGTEKLEKDLEYYKRALASANRRLAALPKGSFVALTVESRGRKDGWKSECSIYVDDNDSVRKNNELRKLYDALRVSLGVARDNTGYIEDGTREVPGR